MSYQATAKVLDALGDPTRRAVLELIRGGARPVGEIAAELPVSRPAVSQHLHVLKEAGLVRDRKDGTRRLYSVDPEGLQELRRYLEGFWDTALVAFKDAAEGEAKESGAKESGAKESGEGGKG
jgi:DNA-binding transcriptional ArsR family regulator